MSRSRGPIGCTCTVQSSAANFRFRPIADGHKLQDISAKSSPPTRKRKETFEAEVIVISDSVEPEFEKIYW